LSQVGLGFAHFRDELHHATGRHVLLQLLLVGQQRLTPAICRSTGHSAALEMMQQFLEASYHAAIAWTAYRTDVNSHT
jgi:hypothetical protein